MKPTTREAIGQLIRSLAWFPRGITYTSTKRLAKSYLRALDVIDAAGKLYGEPDTETGCDDYCEDKDKCDLCNFEKALRRFREGGP